MSQSLINDLSDQVSSLRAALARAELREATERARANRAEADLASLRQVDDARRQALAGTVLAHTERSQELAEAQFVIGALTAVANAALNDALVEQIIKQAREDFRAVTTQE